MGGMIAEISDHGTIHRRICSEYLVSPWYDLGEKKKVEAEGQRVSYLVSSSPQNQ